MTVRSRSQRGATVVEFAILVPIIFAIFGLALFAAHIYEVKSDLQIAAQRTAGYMARRCDYRGTYPAASTCATTGYHGEAEALAFANEFDIPPVVAGTGMCEYGAADAVLCHDFTPALAAEPTPNQRIHVRVKQKYHTPLGPFLKALGVGDGTLDIEGRGEAVVE